MSTLQVANVHLESTGNNRIQYAGSNSYVIVAGGANTLTVNSTAVTANVNIPSGGTIGFNGTDVTITHSSNKLDIDGGVVNFGSVPTVNNVSVGITTSTAVATTSGTSKDFTGIPAGVKRIIIMFDGSSNDSGSQFIVQIGPVGGIETSGYLSTSANLIGATTQMAASTAGFIMNNNSAAAVLYGALTLTLMTGNTWVASGVISRESGSCLAMGGSKTLAGVLTQLRITSVSGTANFDAGSVNICYEQ